MPTMVERVRAICKKKNPRTVDSSRVYIMEQGTGIEPVLKTAKPLIILHFFGLRLHYDGNFKL